MWVGGCVETCKVTNWLRRDLNKHTWRRSGKNFRPQLRQGERLLGEEARYLSVLIQSDEKKGGKGLFS